jgi:hypothetical protein
MAATAHAQYTVLSSFEPGFRIRDVRGDEGKYRSDVNYGNGLRLLSSSLRVNSRDGRGRFFDELSIQTLGLGNDPYEFSSLRIEKNRLYRYDFTWRLQDYFNPALTLGLGRHFMNTERRIQDHDFTLTPHAAVRLFAGYSRNRQDGPALSTFQPDFDLLADVRRLQNDYRAGAEVRLFGTRFTVLRGWSRFSDHTQLDSADLRRTEPYHGSSPYWRVSAQHERRLVSAAARFSYAGARRRFFFEELAAGDRQALVSGSAHRPVGTGSFALSLFPGRRLTFTNSTSFYNTRMSGDNVFTMLESRAPLFENVEFRFLGIRTVANLTDASLRLTPWASLYGGYHFSTRRIRAARAGFESEQENTLHSGLAGVRLQPAAPLTLNLDVELGRADRPFFPVSEHNYHALGGRVQYRARTVTLSAAARTSYNTSPVSLADHSSRNRHYSAEASWAPRNWFAFDAGYTKLHLDALTGIAYFVQNQFARDRSLYVSELHTTHVTTRFAIRGRADLSLGYSRVQDTADARGGAHTGVFDGAQAYPMLYDTPLARLSILLHEKLRWNATWQYYRFDERRPDSGQPPRNYNAHTGATSLLWSF